MKNFLKSKINPLAHTARGLLHMSAEFTKCNNLTDELKLVLADDELQKVNSRSCGNSQLYFYNLFDPLKNSKIEEHQKLAEKQLKHC